MAEEKLAQPEEIEEIKEETPTLLDKFKIHKLKILGIILGILVFSGAVFGAYKFGQRSIYPEPVEGPTPTPIVVATPTSDPTANWKTYTNTKYGYSIKYPEELYFDETKTLFIEEKYKDIGRGGIPFIQIDVFDNNKQSLKDFFSAHATKLKFDDPDVSKLGSSLYFPEYSEPEEITIAGQKALRFTTESMEGRLTHILLIKDKYAYDLVAGIEITTDLPIDNIKRFYNLMLSTFRFLEEEKNKVSFRVDGEGNRTAVVIIDESGQERILREYLWPHSGPARKVYPSVNNKFLGISMGTGVQGALEIVNLENEVTITTLSEYGKVIWLDEQRLVLNVPEEITSPRPYEGGEGISLATFDAVLNQYKILKKADSNTDYALEKVEDNKIFFEKKVVADPNDWSSPMASRWKINFDGTAETKVE